jgi:hypothetical protein
MDDRHGDAEGQHPQAHGAKGAQLPRGGHAHFQQEQHQHTAEQIDEERLDPGEVFLTDRGPHDETATQQQQAAPAQRFRQDDAQAGGRVLAAGECQTAIEEGHEDAEFHQRDQAGDITLHRGTGTFGKAARDDEGDRGDRAVKGGHSGGIPDIKADDMARGQIGDGGDHEDQKACHGDGPGKVAQIGGREFPPALQADGEKKEDREDADHGFRDVQIGFDEGGNDTHQEGERDGRDQVFQKDGTVHGGSLVFG